MKTKLKVVIFDFDGVIVDSNRLKTDVWFEIFEDKEWPILTEVLKKVGKESRYVILNTFFGLKGINHEAKEDLVNTYASLYSSAVHKGIQSRGLNSYAHTLLEFLNERGLALYVNSSTPELSLRDIVVGIQIGKFFKAVYGYPRTKIENLKKILDEEKITPHEAVFIGDGDKDWFSARECDMPFIGIRTDFNDWNSDSSPFPLASNLREVSEIIDNMCDV